MKDPLFKLLLNLKPQDKILDVGCLNYSLFHKCKNESVQHFGIDYVAPQEPLPSGYTFQKVDLNKESLPHENDFFDLIVASHVIEHLQNPIDFFGDCLRILKPGGKLYLSAPSEKSLKLSGMPFAWDQFFSLSFYDDPTHQYRPWPPGSLYRLAKYYSATPLEAGYITSWKARLAFPFLYPYARLFKKGKLLEKLVWDTYGWTSCAVIEKPQDKSGAMSFTYYIPGRK